MYSRNGMANKRGKFWLRKGIEMDVGSYRSRVRRDDNQSKDKRMTSVSDSNGNIKDNIDIKDVENKSLDQPVS